MLFYCKDKHLKTPVKLDLTFGALMPEETSQTLESNAKQKDGPPALPDSAPGRWGRSRYRDLGGAALSSR